MMQKCLLFEAKKSCFFLLIFSEQNNGNHKQNKMKRSKTKNRYSITAALQNHSFQ
jgi:hypothetical protein